MNIDNAFPSKFLKAAEFEDGDQTLTIKSVTVETVGQGDDADAKPIVYFQEIDKGLALNKTNANTVKKLLDSADTDRWVGKRITIGYSEVEFKGEMVPAIRVRTKAPASDPVEAAKAAMAAFVAEAQKFPTEYPTATRDEKLSSVKKVLDWNSTTEPTIKDIERAADVLKEKSNTFDPFGDE